eukprot:6162624-Pyramimonas_sp.AAC.2
MDLKGYSVDLKGYRADIRRPYRTGGRIEDSRVTRWLNKVLILMVNVTVSVSIHGPAYTNPSVQGGNRSAGMGICPAQAPITVQGWENARRRSQSQCRDGNILCRSQRQGEDHGEPGPRQHRAGRGALKRACYFGLARRVKTVGNLDRANTAQGVSNIIGGLFCTMGSCAMIVPSNLNTMSGGKGRLSGITCAAFMFSTVLFFSKVRLPTVN